MQQQVVIIRVHGFVTTDINGNLASDGGALITFVNANTTTLASNSALLASNTLGIANNSARITNAENVILNQLDGVDQALSGVAIALALPDAYLGNHENFAVAGGIGNFGNETGFAVNVIARGDAGWSFGAGIGTSGGEVGTKLQARWATR